MLEPFRTLFSLRWTNEPSYTPLPASITRTFIPVPNANDDKSKRLELLVCRPRPHSSTIVTLPHSPLSRSSSYHVRNANDNVAAETAPTPKKKSSIRPPAILFVHGGFGSAAMYADFMCYLSTRYEAPTYALSLRGHGASYSLSYFRMVYLTGLNDFASDLNLAIRHINHEDGDSSAGGSNNQQSIRSRPRKRRRLIIVGHSSGGGLVQYALARRLLTRDAVDGLVLLDAIPNFGNLSVYANWARHDPWFSLRMSLVHLNHVASPLSSDDLVRSAFFGAKYVRRDRDQVSSITGLRRIPGSMLAGFRRLMTPYESLLWPLGMMSGFWDWIRGRGGKWLDAKDILSALTWRSDGREHRADSSGDQAEKVEEDDGEEEKREKVLVMVGSEDVLIDTINQQRMVEQYRQAHGDLVLARRSQRVSSPRTRQRSNTKDLIDSAITLYSSSSVRQQNEHVTCHQQKESEEDTESSLVIVNNTDTSSSDNGGSSTSTSKHNSNSDEESIRNHHQTHGPSIKTKSTHSQQPEKEKEEEQQQAEEGVTTTFSQGIRFSVVHGAGHHLQNEVMWEKAAEQIRRFAMNV